MAPGKGVFTIEAKDNIDKNSSCTVSKSHYHGTSLSLFQFPSTEKKGTERTYNKFVNIKSSESKKVRELPCFYTDFKEIKDPPIPFFLSVPTVNIPEEMCDSIQILKQAREDELEWLSYVSKQSDSVSDTSWSVYHSKKDVTSEREICLYSILPLLRQNVNSFSMQKHCIEITKAAVALLNPDQVVVDVSDQPVYAMSRQLQQYFPEEFGPGKYFPMFGGLHIEKLLLEIHGQLIDGSGLSELIDVSNVSISGGGNVLVNVPQITSARYLLQVCLCAEFKSLQDVYIDSQSSLDIQQWMEEMALENNMFHYWKLIFDFQILILLFICAQREKNFLLYVHVLKSSMKYIFAFNHYNYARWLSIHVNDLMRLSVTCPDIYDEFMSGKFVLQKTDKPFSAIALDQGHEQKNATIKGAGGAIGLLSSDMESALRRWEVAAPDICRLVGEYEELYKVKGNDVNKKHHEDYTAFQKTFFSDVVNVSKSFVDICNPFAEKYLVTLHNGKKMGLDVQNCLANLLNMNEQKYNTFCDLQLEHCEIPVSATVKNNGFNLPSSISKDTTKTNRVQQAKIGQKFAKSFQIASPYRNVLVQQCFQYEITEHPSSLTDGGAMYHSNKSDLLK